MGRLLRLPRRWRSAFWRSPAAAARGRSNCRRARRPAAARRDVAADLAGRHAAPGSPQDTAMKTGFDAQGNPVAAPGQKRSFILDPLLQ